MAQVKKFSGILNTDDPEAEVPFGHHIQASNITFRGTGNGLRAQNIVGTTAISNSDLPSGTNECIGSFYDQVRQRIYWFNWNSNSRHGIYYYDVKAGTIVPLLICFTDSADDILDFDRDYPIASVNILYGSEDVGDTILWTARNNRPQKLNVDDAIANLYGTAWLADYLTVARKMPLYSPFCEYKDDATVTINNLRKKLYEFRFRWVYKDLTKSTWSPYSKLFAPANPDDVANDIDPTKNNRIDVTVNTGDADVVKVEIAARQTLIDTFSDCFLITTLDKEDLGLLDNEQYIYQFFSDQSYPEIDPEETDLLFDYVPKIANAQELLNGNVIIYGGITEGYDFNEELDVTLTTTSVTYSSAAALSVTVIFNFNSITEFTSPDPKRLVQIAFLVAGTPNTGDVVTITFESQFLGATPEITYTVLMGDDASDVAAGLIAAFNVISASGLGIYDASTYVTTDQWQINMVSPYGPPENEGIADGPNGLLVTNIGITYASSSNPVDGVANSIYKHKSRYTFGMVYFDRFGVTNGVVTNDDFLVETPEVSTTGATATTIPRIAVSVAHQPPIWAAYFSFVRTSNLSVQTLLSTVSAATLKDTSVTINYAYINIRNQQNNEFGYSAYEFTEGDRVRVLGRYNQAIGTVYDFPISAFKTDPKINGATEAGNWLVIPYNAVLVNFGTVNHNNYSIEIYTPAISTTEDQQVYYEFGETYEVLDPYTSGRRHQGAIQNQIIGTGSQPATYAFIRGDFYLKQRKIPLAADLSNVNNVYIIDQSVSDLFPSKVQGNGRAFVVDEYAKEVFFPTMVRWSLAYQQNTNINDTNRFYPQNFDEVDRSRGDIQRLKARDRILRVFQNRAVGQYGVYTRFIQNNSTSSELVTTNDIITTNNIQYYAGEFGLGTQYTGLASASNIDYFADPVRGVQCRVSGDGITPISVLYKGQFYIRSLIVPYNKDYVRTNGATSKILGFYDFYEEQYHCILQEGEYGESTIGAYNFSFNEARNGYASFYSWIPEWVIGAEDITYSWFQGALYIHNNTTDYCKFYGTQYNASITTVFNQNLLQKKTFEAVSQIANNIWICPTINTNSISYVGTPTVYQTSSLISNDFVTLEGNYHAAFLRDANSIGGILEGETLKGNWISITFSITTASDLYYLSEVSVNFVDSPLTKM